MRMKRWLPIVAAAFLVAGCDNSNDKSSQSPQAPQASSGTSSASSSTDENLVTGPRGPAETLPKVEVPNAPAGSATKPKEDLTRPQEQQAMPKAGQANDHSSEASGKPAAGTESSSAPASSAQGGTASGSTQLAQAGSNGSSAAASSGAAAGGGAAHPISQEEALELMKKHNCSSCHAVDKKLVGPSYKEVAAKYKGDPSAETRLIDKVVKGGSGVWGAVPMPPHPNVPKDDIKALVDWILAGAG